MKYDVLSQKVIETEEHIIKGYSLRISIVATENGRMLKIALMDWGGFEIAFFTDSNYLVINRNVCSNELVKLQVELPTYYGYNCDLSFTHTKKIFKDFALFDVTKIWHEFGYIPTKKYNFSGIMKEIINWEK